MESAYTISFREVAKEGGDKVAVNVELQSDIALHDHNFFELVYVTGGTAVHTLNGVVSQIQERDYFLVDYGSRHSYTESRDFALINCLFLPEIIDDTLLGCRSVEQLLRVCLMRYYKQYVGEQLANRIFRDEDGEILGLLLGMQREYIEKQAGYLEVFRCRLMELLIRMMRNIILQQETLPVRSKVVEEAVSYIRTNYQKKGILGSFCKERHYSPQYISRLFKEETGIGISEYQKRIRMEQSCRLLAGSDVRIGEIAELVGYEDVAFFRQVFKENFDMSPREYRNYNR